MSEVPDRINLQLPPHITSRLKPPPHDKWVDDGKMRRCLAIRWGAFGDLLYALPALERLKKMYGYLHLETTSRGHEIFRHSPTFDRISSVDLMLWDAKEWGRVADLRWNLLHNEMDWDYAVNFWHCLESSCIVEEHEVGWHWERERRQKEFAGKNFYDEHFKRIGLTPPPPEEFDCGTISFDEDTAEWMRYFKYKYRDRFIVGMPLAGSTGQKCPHDVLYQIAHRIEEEIPEVLLVQLGAKQEVEFQFKLKNQGNVIHGANVYPYLQSAAICKVADYVVGPETSLLVFAGTFGTPKSMLCTASGVEQTCAYHRNDFSVQSKAPCSPCYRAIYDQKICNIGSGSYGEQQACNFDFDIDRVMEGVRFAYKMRGVRREIESLAGRHFGSLPDLRSCERPARTEADPVRQRVPRRIPASRGNGTGKKDKPGTMVPCSEVYASLIADS